MTYDDLKFTKRGAGWYAAEVDGWTYHIVNVNRRGGYDWRLARNAGDYPTFEELVKYQHVGTLSQGRALCSVKHGRGEWYDEVATYSTGGRGTLILKPEMRVN